MNLALASKLPALPRRVLTGSVAALLLAGSALGAEVIWNGTPQTLTSANGGDDVTLESGTVVTLGAPGTTVLENSILNNSLGLPGVTTLTINSADATKRTLVSGGTALGTVSGQSLVIAGTADFRTGRLSDNGQTNVQLIKNGGTGELILDGIFNQLGGALLRVIDGTVSVEGGGGTDSPISTLLQAIRIESTTAKLRLGTPNGSATTFNNSLFITDSGTLEHTATGNDTLTGSVTIENAKNLTASVTDGSLTLSGNIVGGGLSKTGAAALILSGENFYNGATTVSGGTLQFAREVSLYSNTPASWTKANITVSTGATLAFNVGGSGEFTTADVTTLLGNLTTAISNNGLRAGSKIGFDTTNAAGGNFTIANIIADSTGTGAGSLGLAKLGTNTLTLTSANTYTGGTTVNNGTLALNGTNNGTGVIRGVVSINPGATLLLVSANALGYNAGVAVTTVNINGGLLDNTATFDQGFNQTYNLTGGIMQSNGGVSSPVSAQYYAFGTGTAVNTFASATTSVIAGRINLRNDNSHTDVTFSVADGAAATDLLVSAAITESFPAVGITKAGPGFMQVTGANSYTGSTVVSAGTLSLTGSLGNTAINVSPGATFAARPGSGTGFAGTNITAGTSGLTLSGGAASAASFNMVDNAIGTFRVGTGGLLTQAGAILPTLTFEIGSTLGSTDRLDLGTMGGNAVIAPGTKVDFATLTGATSLVVGNYTFLTTAVSGLGPSVLTLASSTITVGTTTYNLSLANSTLAAEILTITAVASGNNSQLLITSSPDASSVTTGASAKAIALGRVMQNSLQTTPVQTIGKTGTDATTYAVTPAGAVTTTLGGANFAAGTQSAGGTITLTTTATGSQTGTVTIANTVGTSLSAGLGSADASDVFTLTGTVLRQRGTDGVSAFSASSVSVGRILLGGTGSGTTTVATAGGNDSNYTRVTVAGGASIFDGGAGTGTSQTRGVSGPVNAASGTLASLAATTAESAGVNDTVAYSPILVPYTATPLALRSVNATALSLGRQLATANLNSIARTVTFNSSGTHANTTDVTVDGSLLFNGGSNSQGKSITGQNAVIGASGTFYSAPVVSAETGLGDTYANVAVSYTATPLALRSVSGSAGDLGRVMSNTNLNTLGRTTTFISSGAHADTTDVTVDGTLLFNGGSNSQNKSITGQNALIGASGTFYSAPVVSGESGLGDTYGNVTVGYTATPLLDRVITADTVGFGLVHVGAVANAATTLRTTGDNSSRTAVSVGNGSGGGFSLTGGTNPVFTDASVTDGRTLGGTLGTAGALANVTALTVTPGTEAGVIGTQTPVAVVLKYSADVFSGSAVWNGPNLGSWGTSASANWTDTATASIHAAPGTFGATFAGTDTAIFNAAGNGTVNLDGATPSLAAVTFSSGSHTLAKGAGSGVLTLKNDAGSAAITDSAGIQSVTAPVALSSNVIATVTQAADLLTLSGGIDGTGKTLTKEGAGTLTLSGLQHYATLIANAGVTNLNAALGTGASALQANARVNINASQTLASLVVGNGAEVTFGDGVSLVASPEKLTAAVPEPGSVGLLLAGGLGVLGRRRRPAPR